MTWDECQALADAAAVQMAARPYHSWDKQRLEPHLWEALRIELQARYRRATGEEFATLIVQENHDDH